MKILFFKPIMTILSIEHSPYDPIFQLQNLNYSTASILICMPLELRSANLHLEIVSSEKPLTGVWIGVGTLLENLLFPQLQSTSRWGDNECQLTEQDRNLLPLFMFNHSHIFIFFGGRIQNQIRKKLKVE